MRVHRRLLAVAAATACLCGGVTPAEATVSGPPPPPGPGSPAGANDWGCHPGPAHPRPVVLVHGLGATMGKNWQSLSPLLAASGYCVFALTYGVDPRLVIPPFDRTGGVVPMERSAQELSTFVDRVLTATGASKVDIVGHSEGSLMPDWYVRFLGGAARVEHYVGIAPLWHGTNLLGLATLTHAVPPLGLSAVLGAVVGLLCGSCPEFVTGSAFLQRLNADGGPAAPGVTYTNLMTRYDQAVVPYTSGVLDAPGVTNIVVQDQCPKDSPEHGSMASDPVVARDVLNALDPAHARPVRCGPAPALAG
ncbi:MAG: triacylglycerol lipase [Chloroflexota bacterium]|jgi:triacylglycerol esterase/lipase EstA (alpha/beta hydrolase family)|nr:triacylglycerol lipase [Chloroflexota bacterium]